MSEPVVALFCGSREWTDRVAIADAIDTLPPGSIIIEGGARGADRIAREAAHARGLHVATVNALWGRHGNAAGPKRNAAMLALRPDVIYAFQIGASRGTSQMLALARHAGVRIVLQRRERVMTT